MSNPVTSTLRQRSIDLARSILNANPVYLDTETTGLGNQDEIVEISIIDDAENVLFNSLVKPSQAIPPGSTAIHGITDDEVQAARAWPVVWPEVRGAFFGRLIVIYNAEFDLRMMQQSHARYRLPWRENLNTLDAMQLYAEYYGEWDRMRGSYRIHKLEAARQHCHLTLPNAHRATADALLARALFHYMAENE